MKELWFVKVGFRARGIIAWKLWNWFGNRDKALAEQRWLNQWFTNLTRMRPVKR